MISDDNVVLPASQLISAYQLTILPAYHLTSLSAYQLICLPAYQLTSLLAYQLISLPAYQLTSLSAYHADYQLIK
jgi:hypothetical protein